MLNSACRPWHYSRFKKKNVLHLVQKFSSSKYNVCHVLNVKGCFFFFFFQILSKEASSTEDSLQYLGYKIFWRYSFNNKKCFATNCHISLHIYLLQSLGNLDALKQTRVACISRVQFFFLLFVNKGFINFTTSVNYIFTFFTELYIKKYDLHW